MRHVADAARYDKFTCKAISSSYRCCRLGLAICLVLLEHETMTYDDDYLDDARDEARLMADDEPDSKPGICPACSGSGEGMHDGTRCGTCKGAGECY